MDNSHRRSLRDLYGRKSPGALWKMLPQSVPYAMNIDPTNLCNFRCPFCPTGHPTVLARVGHPKGSMELELFRQIMDDLRELTRRAGRKVARLQLWKDGEPLLHRQSPEMIRLAQWAEVTDSVETTTDGLLLSEVMIRGLVDAGLDVLRVSVEHIADSVYQTISHGRVGYGDSHRDVSDLYAEKERSNSALHIHAKIIDTGLSKAENATFVEDFAPMCDSWNIEFLCGWLRVQTHDLTLGIPSSVSVDGVIPKRDRLVCPEPFTKLAINFNGSTCVCCVDWSHETVVGNAAWESVSEIWNGRRLAAFRICHLSGQRATIPARSSCDHIRGFPSFADLDDHREELRQVFGGKAS